jgi:DNA segregation ATPase FtsK/SpoIIIE-like protein
MNTFMSISKRIWLIISAIMYRLLSIAIFCLSILKDLLAPEENKKTLPEYATKQNLYAWLDEYFKQKNIEKPTAKTVSPDNDDTATEINPEEEGETETIPPDTPSYGALPPVDLLADYPQENNGNIAEEVENKKQLIKQTLGDFGISVTDITVTAGATVTLYELVPARGVAIDKITSKDTEIAIALKVEAVRIIAPFKNRGTVAIEVPNENRSIGVVKK